MEIKPENFNFFYKPSIKLLDLEDIILKLIQLFYISKSYNKLKPKHPQREKILSEEELIEYFKNLENIINQKSIDLPIINEKLIIINKMCKYYIMKDYFDDALDEKEKFEKLKIVPNEKHLRQLIKYLITPRERNFNYSPLPESIYLGIRNKLFTKIEEFSSLVTILKRINTAKIMKGGLKSLLYKNIVIFLSKTLEEKKELKEDLLKRWGKRNKKNPPDLKRIYFFINDWERILEKEMIKEERISMMNNILFFYYKKRLLITRPDLEWLSK